MTWLTFMFDQAESELSDKAKREEIDAVINQARAILLKSLLLPTTTPDSDPRLRNLAPPWRQQLLAKAKELLIDEEVRRRKYVYFVAVSGGYHSHTRISLGLSR